MKKALFAVSVAMILILIPCMLFAGRGRVRPERGLAWLELSGEQLEKLEQLRLEHRIGNVDLRAERDKLRLKMKQELLRDEPDTIGLENLAADLSAVRQKIQKNRIGHLLKVKGILNDDQWNRFIRRHFREGERRVRGRRLERAQGRITGMRRRMGGKRLDRTYGRVKGRRFDRMHRRVTGMRHRMSGGRMGHRGCTGLHPGRMRESRII